LMKTVPEANDALSGLQAYFNNLSGPNADSIRKMIEVNSDYNLIILFICDNDGMRAGYSGLWKLDKVKR